MPKANVTYNSWGDPVESTNGSGETVWGDAEAFPSASAPASAPAAGQRSDGGGVGAYKQESFLSLSPPQGSTQEQGQTQPFPLDQYGYPIFSKHESESLSLREAVWRSSN